MARDGPVRACAAQARLRTHGWTQALRDGGAGRMAGPDSGNRSGLQAAAAPAVRRAPQLTRCRHQVKPPQRQPGGTVDALNSAPAAAIASSVASHAQTAAPVTSVAPAAAPAALVHAPVAVVPPAAAPVDAQAVSLPQFQSTMLSEHSAHLQDLQRQMKLLNKDFQRQLLQLRQQLLDREEVISQLQHQFIKVQEEVQGNSRG